MATWKKVVVSGSDISQLNNDAGYITSITAQHAFNTASYDGTEITAGSSNGNLSFDNDGIDGLTISADAGTDTLTFGLSSIPNTSLANSTISGVSLGSNLSSLSSPLNGGVVLTGAYNGSAPQTVSLNIENLTPVAPVMADDSLAFGVSASPTMARKVTISDFVTAMAGTGLTATNGVLSATNQGDITEISEGDGITITDGTGPIPTVTLNTGSSHFVDGARKSISTSDTTGASGIDLTYSDATGILSGVLQNSSITLGSTSVDLGATATTLTGLTSVTSTTFVGDLNGNADTATSALSADSVNAGDIVGDIALGTGTSGDYVSNLGTGTGVTIGSNTGEGSSPTITVDYGTAANTAAQGNVTLEVLGTGNEIEITNGAASAIGTNRSITVGLPDDVTISQDLIINRNLTVIGTASFQHQEDLDVADRFIRLASGSNANGDGGIVIQQTSQTNGEAFAYDASAVRWGVQGNFDASDSSFSPEAFMAAAVIGTNSDPDSVAARYDKGGNIFVGTDENIWIYS